MSNQITPSAPHKNFESIKKIDKNGIEYWVARELLPLLGYANWQKAEELIARAARACINSGQDVDNHFIRSVKMVEIGSNTVREKGIKKGELLDRAGSAELAANLFRITQTDEKLKKDRTRGEYQASQTHFMVGGKVRQTIKEIGGTSPEHLPIETHIKEVKKIRRDWQKRIELQSEG